jgi:WD40 repeat protein
MNRTASRMLMSACVVACLLQSTSSIESVAVAPQSGSPQPFPRLEAGMHTAPIGRIAVDAKERFLVTASHDKSARVWDLVTGKLLTILRPPIGDDKEGKLYTVALSPDGATIAVGGFTGKAGSKDFPLYLFDRLSGRMTRRLGGLPAVTYQLASSFDGRFLAAALGGKNGIRVFRVSDGGEVWRDSDYQDQSHSVEFDRKGRLLATSYDGELRLYGPVPELKLLAKQSAPGGKQPHFARFSPDAARIAVGFSDSTTVNVLSGDDLRFLYAPDTSQVNKGNLSSIAWSADGNRLYAAGGFNQSGLHPIVVWPQAGRGTPQVWPASTNTILDLRPLANGRLVFGAFDPAWGMLDTQGKRLVGGDPPILDHRGNASKLRLARDGSTVEFGFDVWANGTRQQRLARFDLRERRFALDVSPASTLSPPRTEGLDIRDWRNNDRPTLHGKPLSLQQYETSRSLAIAEDRSRFVLGTEWHLRLFDPEGKKLWQKPVPSVARAVNLSTDGRFAVAALGDGTLRWYDARNGNERLALFVHPDAQRWVLFTPEGFFDASPGADALIGYQLNQGTEKEGQFIGSDQLVKVFNRPDLVARRLAGEERPITDALQRIGDVRTVLARGLPPKMELLSPAQVTQSGADFVLTLSVTDQGGGIGQIVYRINGREIEGRPEGIPSVGSGHVSRRFSLAPGRHVVSATAYNQDGKVESKPIETVVERKASTDRGDLYVLAVGISKYRDNAFARGVRFAAQDAGALVERLRARAATLYDHVYVHTLLDDKATLDAMEKAFADLSSRIRPIDAFVFFVAGHGTARDGQYHFIPADLSYENDDVLVTRSFNQARIERNLKRINAERTVVVLDTCSSGAMAGRAGPEDKAAIAQLMRATGHAVLAAASSLQMALEQGEAGHGVFTYALLQGMDGAADANGDGLVDIDELAAHLAKTVPEITKRRWGIEQQPMRKTVGTPFPVTRVK